MKRNTWHPILSSLLVFCLPACATAQGSGEYWARVIEAEPVWQQVRIPVENDVCWNEQVQHVAPARRSVTPRILGAIVGGVIGHQFGGGSGQDIMTVAGAALGASVAADQQHRSNPDRVYSSTQRRCDTRTEWRYEDRIVAWDVTYEFNGMEHRARLNEAPGDRIRIRVDVAPLQGG